MLSCTSTDASKFEHDMQIFEKSKFCKLKLWKLQQ